MSEGICKNGACFFISSSFVWSTNTAAAAGTGGKGASVVLFSFIQPTTPPTTPALLLDELKDK